MGDEENSSFHGSLSRFAYAPPSNLSSSFPPGHDHEAASTPFSINGDNNINPKKSSVPPATLSSREREGGDSRRRRADARSRKRRKSGNATTHLAGIPDCIAEDLDVLFCGINPGHMSAVTGHHYANPTNHFWHCLHLSGFTPRLLLPSEDLTLPERFNLGLINLVDRPSTSQADLSAQEMASSVPALLTKIARLRPRVTCFIGKGIWLHVERALNLLKDDKAGNQNTGTGTPLGAHTQGNVVQPVKTQATPMDGRSVYFLSDSNTPPVMEDIQRPSNTEPERCLDCYVAVKLEETQGDVSSEQPKTISEVEETAETSPTPSSLSRSTTRRRGGVTFPKRGKTPPSNAFAYGLQPFKALHDVVPYSASVSETLFCVFPSTSGRVVSHQRDDKIALFKALREDIEPIKARTLDTRFMQIIHLHSEH